MLTSSSTTKMAAAASSCRPFLSLLKRSRGLVIGMVHLQALPGSPRHKLSLDGIVDLALKEVSIYKDHKVDCVLIENMHDRPYLNGRVGPEVVAAMTAVGREVKRAFPDTPFGVQVLAGCNFEALAIAMATGGSFIRAEGFVYSHVADEGWIDSSAGELLRYRRRVGADTVSILTDIKKKHSSHAVTSDVSLGETAKAAEFFLSDGVIITGSATGDPVKKDDLIEVRSATSLPVVLGSGVNENNVEMYMDANGFIVGSHFKEDGLWYNPVDPTSVRTLMDKIHAIRSHHN